MLQIRDLALCLQICFVPDREDQEVIVKVLDSIYVKSLVTHLLETAGFNGKPQQEAVSISHVLRPNGQLG
jgi:hypothetical protein